MATSWTAPGLLLIICLLPSSSLALHPRNAFKGSYDMAKLVAACPSLSRNLVPAHLSKGGRETIDFSDPDAVKCLNQAILTADYGIAEWSIPEGKLCPPIPGRADYVHHMADVLAFSARCKTVPLGPCVRGMVRPAPPLEASCAISTEENLIHHGTTTASHRHKYILAQRPLGQTLSLAHDQHNCDRHTCV